ncbi:MAG: ABC transporter substrate-binding protein, partial [Microcystaceae cyanobacterium]
FKGIRLDDNQLDIQKTIQETIKPNYKAALLLSSVKTNSVAIAIAREVARENSKLPSTQKIQLFGSLALAEEATLIKAGSAVEGMIFVNPCLAEKSDYIKKAAKRWQKINDWRITTSYDATQAFIGAILLSEEPKREEILKRLKTLTLPVNETSGFGLKWSTSDQSNANRKYCLFEIRKNKKSSLDYKFVPLGNAEQETVKK